MKLRPSQKTNIPAAVGKYPSPMRTLFTLGEPKPDYSYTDLTESLKDYVPQLIELALDDDINKLKQTDPAVWSPLHALAILRELRAVEAVEPLLEMMDWDDEWIEAQLPQVYGAIGAPALPALKAYTMDSSNDQWGRGRALASLTAVAQAHEETRDEVVHFFINFLDRPGAGSSVEEESLTASLVGELGDLQATESYEAIRRAFDENRVDETIVQLEDIERDFGMRAPLDFNALPARSPESGLTLTLRCQACGRERQYHFARAYFDINQARTKQGTSTYSPLIVPERVTCPKCGAVDQYELTPIGELAILAAQIGKKAGQPEPFPGLQVIGFTTNRWGPMHPREALKRYADEVARHPGDLELRVGYGNSLRMLGYIDEAMDQYEQVLLVEPLHGEALINTAQLLSLQGDTATAIDAWERIERVFDRLDLPEEDREMRHQEVVDTLTDLRNGIVPEYSKQWIAMAPTGESAPRPAVPSTPRLPPYGKVGRNEPCPCGSGKKYKHCHGRK
jgi:tetratricopeptide (TPR) repeat protein